MRTQRVSQAQLNHDARTSYHKKQGDKAIEMLDNGWRVYGWKEHDRCRVYFMQRGDTAPTQMHGVLYPDGSFHRPLVGRKTVSYNWKDVKAAAQECA